MLSENLFVTKLYKGTHRARPRPGRHLPGHRRRGPRGPALVAKPIGYRGYTSYASLNDLTRRASMLDDLERAIAKQVAGFARELQFDLGGRKLALDSLWINVMDRNAVHTPHIHPHAAISGTYYVNAPPGAGAITFEDPRLPMMMAAPPRKPKARPENLTFVTVTPKAGTLLLWESWLRHGVEPNAARAELQRISGEL